MPELQRLPIEPLLQAVSLPYLQVWSGAIPTDPGDDGCLLPLSDFWHAGAFDPGAGGQTEALWVNYRNSSLQLSGLEVHWRTEQVIVPLQQGGVLQVVCPSRADDAQQPDTRQLRCFEVKPGQGLNMKPGCWHASFVRAGQSRCLMLTRRSTTEDLVGHLRHGRPALESSHVQLTGPGQAGWRIQV